MYCEVCPHPFLEGMAGFAYEGPRCIGCGGFFVFARCCGGDGDAQSEDFFFSFARRVTVV